jgi:hypothetical protein
VAFDNRALRKKFDEESWGEGDHLERSGRIILTCFLQKLDRKALTEFFWLRIELMAVVNTVMNRRVP